MKKYRYVEPDQNGETVTVEVSEEEAIMEMKQKAYPFIYPDDREALLDFIALHWAHEVGE